MTNGEFMSMLTQEQIREVRIKFDGDFRKLICDSTPDEECDRQPSCFECKISWCNRKYTGDIIPIPSIFDTIKTMSIEEFAQFLYEFRKGNIPCDTIVHDECLSYKHCTECIRQWLIKESNIGEEK